MNLYIYICERKIEVWLITYPQLVVPTFEKFYPENESKDAPPIKHRDSQKMYDLSRAHN